MPDALLTPQLVSRAQLTSAIALSSIPWQAGRMIGPSITGILIAAFGQLHPNVVLSWILP